MKTIKVYDLTSYINGLEEIKNKGLEVSLTDKKYAVIQGNNKSLFVHEEGVGYVFNSDEKFPIDLVKSGSKFYSIVDKIEVSIEDIINNCDYKEMILGEYIPDGRRRTENYKEILKSMRKNLKINTRTYDNGRSRL